VWFEVVLLSGYAALAWMLTRPSKKRLRQRGEAFARRNRAFVDSEFVTAFDRVTRWFLRLLGLGVFAYGLLSTVLHATRVDAGSFPVPYFAVLGVFTTAWAVLRLRIAGREFPVPEGRAVVARPRRVTLSDYVSIWVQSMLWLDLILVVACVYGVLQVEPGGVDSMVVFLSLGGAVVLAGAASLLYVAGRAMCERPQAAVDPCHLYFQDAWRGEFLLGGFAYLSSAALVFVGSVAIALDLPGWLDGVGFQSMVVLFGAELFACLGSQLQFRRRLWSTLTPGQILLPGQPVPPRREVAA
jgi:hypothetical protein